MKLYLLSTMSNDRPGAFSRAVVVAEDEGAASRMHPDGESAVSTKPDLSSTWVSLDEVQVEYLGEAAPGAKAGVILASYLDY